MKLRLAAAALLPALAVLAPEALAAALQITVKHDLKAARPSETITVPWSEVNRALPNALIQHIVVKDAKGNALPYQVTNVKPLAKDPQNVGIAYGELIFQHNFAAGEQQAIFTVEKSDDLTPVFPVKAFARYVPERLDDFAWENDKLAHRTYGHALAAPAEPGSGKEVLVTSGLDLWFKRVSYPIVDRWYNKGHDHYHHDEGEGMDMYNVGKSRGAGGTGVWDGKTLYTPINYAGWKVLANGPVRAVFELTYNGFDAAGVQVSEVKRFTVDAGHYLDQIESTLTFNGKPALTWASGLNNHPTDKFQDPTIDVDRDQANGLLVQWVRQKSKGQFGVAVVLPGATGFAEDPLNHLILGQATSGKPVRYYAGGAWDRAGEITSREQWLAYVRAMAERYRSPVSITLKTLP